MPAMNKAVVAGLAAGVLIVGLILSPTIGAFQLFENAQAQSTGKTKKVTLIADEREVQVAPDNPLHPGGVTYNAMVFNGTIPGPVIAVDQGDTLEITLVNEGEVIHSIDFHAGLGPSQAIGANASDTGSNIQSGQNVTFRLQAVNAGAWFYHCAADGLNGIWEHIANGMYGGIVVHPQNEAPAKEFYMVFGEIYGNNIEGLFTPVNETSNFALDKLVSDDPDLVMTNGMAFKYVPQIGAHAKIPLNPDAEIFKVKPGELTRWYIINAGPNDGVSFHFISGQIDVKDGSIKNRYGTQLKNDETWWIPPGSGSVIESTFPEEGFYVGVDHAMKDVLKGAALVVQATDNSTADDHPEGTWVPPRGSEVVSGPSLLDTEAATAETEVPEDFAEDFAAPENEGIVENNQTDTGNQTGAGNQTTTSSTGNQTSSTTNSSQPTVTPTSGSNKVTIPSGASTLTDTAFSPNPSELKVGDTVTWTNDDAQPHTATSGNPTDGPDGKFGGTMEAPVILVKGQTQEFTFTEAGEYDYYCTLHPNMVGTITVS